MMLEDQQQKQKKTIWENPTFMSILPLVAGAASSFYPGAARGVQAGSTILSLMQAMKEGNANTAERTARLGMDTENFKRTKAMYDAIAGGGPRQGTPAGEPESSGNTVGDLEQTGTAGLGESGEPLPPNALASVNLPTANPSLDAAAQAKLLEREKGLRFLAMYAPTDVAPDIVRGIIDVGNDASGYATDLSETDFRGAQDRATDQYRTNENIREAEAKAAINPVMTSGLGWTRNPDTGEWGNPFKDQLTRDAAQAAIESSKARAALNMASAENQGGAADARVRDRAQRIFATLMSKSIAPTGEEISAMYDQARGMAEAELDEQPAGDDAASAAGDQPPPEKPTADWYLNKRGKPRNQVLGGV